MLLHRLILRNFRSYEEATFCFSSKINWIYGDNAQGKTNLLEAIYFLSTGRSFRTQQAEDLIYKGASFFYLEAHFSKDGIEQSLSVYFDGKIKRIIYNQTPIAYFSGLLGILPSVLYASEDIALIIGPPSERRRFLNLHLAQRDPIYIHHLSRFIKAVKQRNTLLKKREQTAIDPWEHALAESAAYLVKKRIEAADELKLQVHPLMQQLSLGKETIHLDYMSSLEHHLSSDWKTSFLKQYQTMRPRELHIGTTLFGPHRDDVSFKINNQSARTFASEGQKRCLIAALKFAEWHCLHLLANEPPLLCIDDINAHLDEGRTEKLKDLLRTCGQVFITDVQAPKETFEAKLFRIEKAAILS